MLPIDYFTSTWPDQGNLTPCDVAGYEQAIGSAIDRHHRAVYEVAAATEDVTLVALVVYFNKPISIIRLRPGRLNTMQA